MRSLQQSKSCLEAHASHCARCGTPMKVRILIPGCKVDYVAYRCEKCGTDVLRSVPRVGYLLMLTPRGWCHTADRSFDHLVGAGEPHWWHAEAECLRGLEID